ncbi:MAG TPA: glutathionylspermidine synthase family protein, partial [Blastocatellia bacterium]|nr:glutathionylspermidine synthase family protein [Blastocatellia bacterium]
ATNIISDPWLGGRERFRLQPVLLNAELADRLAQAAECVGAIYHEVSEVVFDHPELLDEFFGLTPFQKMMWLASGGRWHGIARVDLFLCTDGRIRACEMNSDTPSGEAEAVLLNQLLHPYSPDAIDPNADFAEDFWQMLVASHQARTDGDAEPRNVGIIYPTDLPEDLSMMAIYKRWLEERGCRVVFGSPFNLGLDAEGRVTVMGEAVDLIVRHYKTDWWGERELIWANQAEFADPDPLDRELLLLLQAENEGRVTVVNPFGAVVTQNKLAMALMWERKELFSPECRQWIEDYIPETRRITSLDSQQLQREDWVLKSDYGCEGDSVVCGAFVKPQDWQLALATLIPKHWVAQRFFEVAPIDDGEEANALLPNYGVYLLGGNAAGFFTRLSRKATDYTAVTAPTYILGTHRFQRADVAGKPGEDQ